MGSRRLEAETTAEAYLELLKDRGIDVFLGNAGTDFASLVEAFARFETAGGGGPRPLGGAPACVAGAVCPGDFAPGGGAAGGLVPPHLRTGEAGTPRTHPRPAAHPP